MGYAAHYSADLPNLDAESVGYLMENLKDLTKYDAELSIQNYLHDFTISSWKYMATSFTSTVITMDTRTSSYQTASTDTSTGTMKVRVSGLQSGDRLALKDDNTTFATITEDGDYDIEISARSGWLLWWLQNDDSTVTGTVTVTNRKPYTAGAAFASSGTLYVPSKWETTYDAVEGNDFDTLVSSAIAKGWTIYVGGEERTE